MEWRRFMYVADRMVNQGFGTQEWEKQKILVADKNCP